MNLLLHSQRANRFSFVFLFVIFVSALIRANRLFDKDSKRGNRSCTKLCIVLVLWIISGFNLWKLTSLYEIERISLPPGHITYKTAKIIRTDAASTHTYELGEKVLIFPQPWEEVKEYILANNSEESLRHISVEPYCNDMYSTMIYNPGNDKHFLSEPKEVWDCYVKLRLRNDDWRRDPNLGFQACAVRTALGLFLLADMIPFRIRKKSSCQ